MTENDQKQKLKKLAPGSIPLLAAGELFFAKSPSRDMSINFKRYESLLESLANMNREERLISYKFLIGLILTSHAKKIVDIPTRKALFDMKNALFLNIANNKEYRSKLAFKYLISKNFRVTKFCSRCEQENSQADIPKHQWKFCRECTVDRKFYNVLSMHHKFKSGSATLFLSNDQIHEIQSLRLPGKGKLENFKEEVRFDKYHYNVKNLDVFDLNSVKQAQARLLEG